MPIAPAANDNPKPVHSAFRAIAGGFALASAIVGSIAAWGSWNAAESSNEAANASKAAAEAAALPTLSFAQATQSIGDDQIIELRGGILKDAQGNPVPRSLLAIFNAGGSSAHNIVFKFSDMKMHFTDGTTEAATRNGQPTVEIGCTRLFLAPIDSTALPNEKSALPRGWTDEVLGKLPGETGGKENKKISSTEVTVTLLWSDGRGARRSRAFRLAIVPREDERVPRSNHEYIAGQKTFLVFDELPQ